MKTSRFIFFGVIISICMMSSAQITEHTFQYDLKSVNVVVLNLDGNVKITPSDDHHIQVVSSLTTSGDVWGLKVQKKRPEFNTSSMLSSDTLYMKTPSLFSYTSVGINTYKEQVETAIQVSENVEIIVQHANDIIMTSGFSNIDIQFANSVILIDLDKSRISSLYCNSSEPLVLNGLARSKSFEFQGIGNEAYSINAIQIELIIQ